ncbi:MAG: hypothetical protein V8R80_09630 [Eubacterium sp.]
MEQWKLSGERREREPGTDLYLSCRWAETQEVTVDVHARERSPEDVQKLLDEAVEEWESRFLGKNKSQDN